MVVDDHDAIIHVLSRVLPEHGIDVVAGITNPGDALEAVRVLSPDVAVLDARLPGVSGIEIAARIADDAPDVAVVLYTAAADATLVDTALELRVRGIVLKETPMREVARAIALVARGGSYVDTALSSELVRSRRARGSGLSDRQREVLSLLAEGLSTAEVGGRLGISAATVRTHLAVAMSVLGARTRTHAVALSLRRGLIA